jgi:AraC-like DNA-binding protein
MLRPIPLRRYVSVMQERGFDPASVLRGSGISPDSLDDPHCLVEISAFFRVVDNVVRLSADSGIGLDMGLAREVSDFRILGYAAMVCRSVRQSVQDYWFRYGDAMGMMARIALSERDARTEAGDIVVAHHSSSTYRFFVEEALCVLLKVGGQVSGARPHFESLEFTYPQPSYGARYKELFACPMRFGAERTRVVLSRGWLDQPLKTTDPELLHLYQQNLEQLKQEIEAGSSTSARLRQVFLKLGGRIPPLELAARALEFSPRTLRRRLQQEGLSYRGVVDTFRLDLAVEGLKGGALTTKQLGDQVGFDDVNAFRRAFKKWTGQTVRDYRSSASRRT